MAPKTIAEMYLLHDALAARLDRLGQDVTDLRTADVRFDEQLRAAREELVRVREELVQARKQLDDERALGRERDRVIVEVQKENALLRQQLHDHLRRVETWSAWLRSLISGLVFAVLSLASGLIVTLARK